MVRTIVLFTHQVKEFLCQLSDLFCWEQVLKCDIWFIEGTFDQLEEEKTEKMEEMEETKKLIRKKRGTVERGGGGGGDE